MNSYLYQLRQKQQFGQDITSSWTGNMQFQFPNAKKRKPKSKLVMAGNFVLSVTAMGVSYSRNKSILRTIGAGFAPWVSAPYLIYAGIDTLKDKDGSRGLFNGNSELISIMDASGETIQVKADTPRWSYKVTFHQSEEDGPYTVTAVEMTAEEAKKKGELTTFDAVTARMYGKDDVEAMRNRMNQTGAPKWAVFDDRE